MRPSSMDHPATFMHHGWLVLLITMLACTAHAQEPAFGRRMGDTLDEAAIRYFGLFPSIGDAAAARMSGQISSWDGHFARVIVSRRSAWTQRDTTVMISDSTLAELADYLDNFESRRNQHVVHRLVRDSLIRPGVVPPAPATFDIHLRDGSSVQGRLLYVADSMLVLWTDREEYDWLRPDAIRLVHIDRIDEIERKGSVLPGIAAGLGAAVGTVMLERLELGEAARMDAVVPGLIFGGVIGAGLARDAGMSVRVGGNPRAFGLVMADLMERAEFQSSPPPELRRILSSRPVVEHSGMLPVSMSELMDDRREPRLLVSAGAGFRQALSTNSYVTFEADYNKTVERRVVTPAIERRVEIEYLVMKGMRVGVGYVAMPVEEISGPNGEAVSLSTIGTSIRYDLLPRNGWRPVPFSLSFGAGIGMAFVRESARLYSTANVFIDPDTLAASYDQSASLPTFEACARMDYAFSRYIRTHLRIDARVLPPLRIDDRIGYQKNPWTHGDFATVRVNSHDLELSSVGATVGVSVGF